MSICLASTGATSMSIYRKFADDAKNDVFAKMGSGPVKRPGAAAGESEDAEATRWRKAAPMEAPLPRTFTWVAKLPRDVQPIELMRTYARIANLMAAVWDEPDAMYGYFEDLLHDHRGNRKGFPPAVMAELLALRTYYAGLYPHRMASWEDLNPLKR